MNQQNRSIAHAETMATPSPNSKVHQGPSLAARLLRLNAIAIFRVSWFLLQFHIVRRLACNRGESGEIPPAPRWHEPKDYMDQIVAAVVTILLVMFLIYAMIKVLHPNLSEPESEGVTIVNDGQ